MKADKNRRRKKKENYTNNEDLEESLCYTFNKYENDKIWCF